MSCTTRVRLWRILLIALTLCNAGHTPVLSFFRDARDHEVAPFLERPQDVALLTRENLLSLL